MTHVLQTHHDFGEEGKHPSEPPPIARYPQLLQQKLRELFIDDFTQARNGLNCRCATPWPSAFEQPGVVLSKDGRATSRRKGRLMISKRKGIALRTVNRRGKCRHHRGSCDHYFGERFCTALWSSNIWNGVSTAIEMDLIDTGHIPSPHITAYHHISPHFTRYHRISLPLLSLYCHPFQGT